VGVGALGGDWPRTGGQLARGRRVAVARSSPPKGPSTGIRRGLRLTWATRMDYVAALARPFEDCCIARRTRSGVSGSSVTRAPVAAATALATVAPPGITGGSPT